MKILMLGWEYPPSITGGLGIASQGVAQSLAARGHDISFLLPIKTKKMVAENLRLIDASTNEVEPHFWTEIGETISEMSDVELGSQVLTYMPPQVFKKITKEKKTAKRDDLPEISEIKLTGKYNDGLMLETGKYALLAVQIASKENFDLVYCHDWPTFKAGRLTKEMLGTSMAVHIHSTEAERNGAFVNSIVREEEAKGIRAADMIFAVSETTSKSIVENYSVKKSQITVAPNAGPINGITRSKGKKKKKPVLAFVGRFTHQKSPGTFIDIARELTSRGHDFEFILIGDGYLHDDLVSKCRELNLTDRLKFPGFLSHPEVLEAMSNIDLLVAPSNAEPFGLVMLEAILLGIPVISSPGSGLSEFIPDIPQAERWDIFNCTSLAAKLIEDQSYREEIVSSCLKSAKTLTWENTAAIIDERLTL